MAILTFDTPLMQELRDSLVVGSLTLELAQADAQLKRRPQPAQLTDLHPEARRKYQDAAIGVLMSLNLDANGYAMSHAIDEAYAEVERFCNDHKLDWCERQEFNQDDHLECLAQRVGRKAVHRYLGILTGMIPGLSAYLARLESDR